MYSNVSEIPGAGPLLSGCSAGRRSPSTCLPEPGALLCYAENAQVAECPSSTELGAEEREEKSAGPLFFQLMKQMFGIPPSTALL